MSDTVKDAEFSDDLFDSMVDGSFEPEAGIEEDDEELDEALDKIEDDEDEELQEEDTDQEDEDEEEEELDEDGDGDLDEDLEDELEDEEEDALVDDDGLDDEDDNTEDEEEDSDEEDEAEDEEVVDESEDDTDTEEEGDGTNSETTDEVDYKAFYEAVVNTEFVVNGKKVKGFNDPQKIIQSQQMAGGFSEKMAGFKQYRPYMAPLKERGMLEDQAKFDLAMNLIDGDKEAIKKHLQTLNIDPLDLDMDTIDYSGKANVASQESIIIEDTMERARASGIEDRVRQVVGNDWDAESFQEFVSNSSVRDDLLTHIESGAYDSVQDKINEMSRLDYNGSFSSLNTISKYRAAVGELQKEQTSKAPAKVVETPAPKVVKKANSVKAEKAKIIQARKDEEYKAKAAKQEVKLNQRRKKAASMSKKKVKAKPKAKWDPVEAEGAELDELFDFLAAGGR